MSCPADSPAPNATFSENVFYVAINLQCILYGVQLGVYLKIWHVLARRRERRKSDAFYAIFSTMTFALVTIRVVAEGIFGERMWLIDRVDPGGPTAWGEKHASDTYMTLSTVAVIVLQKMTDALMIHRCRIVWDSLVAIVVPVVLWLGDLALGILVSWAAAGPRFKFFGGITGKIGLAYASVSVCLNAILTCMIWYRLALKKRGTGGRGYLAVDALVMESLLPYTLCGIALLISYGVRSEIAIAFSSVYTLTMCASSQLLVLRVVEGTAWQRNTVGTGSAERGEAGQSEGSEAVALEPLKTLQYATDE